MFDAKKCFQIDSGFPFLPRMWNVRGFRNGGGESGVARSTGLPSIVSHVCSQYPQ
jgi:hypothetical protein